MNESSKKHLTDKAEFPQFNIGDLVQRSHRLEGADIGVFLMDDVRGVVIQGIISFYIGTYKIHPAEYQEIWPYSLIKPAEPKYKNLYNGISQ